MEKLKMHSPNLTQGNIARIRELFPNCVTEVKGEDENAGTDGGENGGIKLAVDFDLLRQELSGAIVEGPQERYHLNWPGKREALLTANAPIAKTLRPCRAESVDFETTKNLFIEGDNLDALKLLQETYLGKVKMIYIDPPYNTGNDFIYDDDFAQNTEEYLARSNQKDESCNRLTANTESNGRFHSDWLSMMYPRLKLARNLLRDDGVIFISIDDNEQANLKRMCDEIFGDINFVGTIGWESKTKSQNTSDSYSKLQPRIEFILCYIKSGNARFNLIDDGKKEYLESDESGVFRFALVEQMSSSGTRSRETMIFPIMGIQPSDGKQWKLGKDSIDKFNLRGDLLLRSNKPTIKMRPEDERSEIKKPFWAFFDKIIGTAESAKKELSNIFNNTSHGFETVKPTNLIERLVFHVSTDDSIILDFFAGSATTAHAVMQLNAEDGGNRKFIMVQLPEICDEKSEAFKAGYKTIAEISKERIRRAGQKIKSDSPICAVDLDIGFRVLKIDTSNMAEVYYTPDALKQDQVEAFVDNIKCHRTSEDLLFQVMLDWGVDLTLPIAKQTIQGQEVFFVDGNALVACFDKSDSIDEAFVKELAKRQPLRVVFRDAGYKNSAVKINVEQIFKLLSPATEVKCI